MTWQMGNQRTPFIAVAVGFGECGHYLRAGGSPDTEPLPPPPPEWADVFHHGAKRSMWGPCWQTSRISSLPQRGEGGRLVARAGGAPSSVEEVTSHAGPGRAPRLG